MNFTIVFCKKWLKENDIEMHSINVKKITVAEKCIKALRSKIYQYITSVSENVYIDKLHDIVNESDDTYHRTIKMKLVDVKDNTILT